MKQSWTLKKAIISSIATAVFALGGAGLVRAQMGAGATTGTPSQGSSSMQTPLGRYDAGVPAAGTQQEIDLRAMAGAEIARGKEMAFKEEYAADTEIFRRQASGSLNHGKNDSFRKKSNRHRYVSSCDPGWILPRGGFILHLKS